MKLFKIRLTCTGPSVASGYIESAIIGFCRAQSQPDPSSLYSEDRQSVVLEFELVNLQGLMNQFQGDDEYCELQVKKWEAVEQKIAILGAGIGWIKRLLQSWQKRF